MKKVGRAHVVGRASAKARSRRATGFANGAANLSPNTPPASPCEIRLIGRPSPFTISKSYGLPLSVPDTRRATMTKRKAPPVREIEPAELSSLTDAQRALVENAAPANRAILIGLFERARNRA